MTPPDAAPVPPLQVEPLTPARWPDLEAVFNAAGCAVARDCWCMYYRWSGEPPPRPAGMTPERQRREALRALAQGARPPGLVGYRGGVPVGWVSLGPREDFPKLRRSPVMKPVDAQPVWSVVCFVVPSPYRGQGIARALLAAAVGWARTQGATLVEGYPVDRGADGRTRDDAMWLGTKTMFDAAGFDEVARRKPQRPVVRLRLAD